MTKYNATVTETSKDPSQTWSGCFVAQVERLNGRLQMLSANGLQTYKYEGLIFTEGDPEGKWEAGDAIYDYYFRAVHPDSLFSIVLDNCQGYINRLGGTNLPPTYTAAMKRSTRKVRRH